MKPRYEYQSLNNAFKSLSLEEHLLLAERHSQLALNKCYTVKGTTRPLFYRLALARAQSILIKLYIKELNKHS